MTSAELMALLEDEAVQQKVRQVMEAPMASLTGQVNSLQSDVARITSEAVHAMKDARDWKRQKELVTGQPVHKMDTVEEYLQARTRASFMIGHHNVRQLDAGGLVAIPHRVFEEMLQICKPDLYRSLCEPEKD